MRQAFTLIELMIVIAIIAIIAAIAIPNLLESRITANESAAAASLKSGIFPAQVQFQSGAYSDIDSNGRGEYASDTASMAGTSTATGSLTTGLSPKALSLISPSFNVADGTAIGAYGYQVDICTSTGTVNGDQINGESYFAAYASPANPGNDGRRAFGINNFGIVYSTKQTLAATTAVIGLTAVSYAATSCATGTPGTMVGGGANTASSSIFVTNPAFSNAQVKSANASAFLK